MSASVSTERCDACGGDVVVLEVGGGEARAHLPSDDARRFAVSILAAAAEVDRPTATDWP